MSDALFITDARGDLLQVNDAFVRFHRFRDMDSCPKTFAGIREVLELTTPDGQPLGEWPLERVLHGERLDDVEVRCRRLDTGEMWLGAFNLAPICDSGGAVVGAVVTAREITERSANRDRLALATAQAPVALAMFDREMRYLAVSDQWRMDYALGDQPLVGRSHYEVFPDLPARYAAFHKRALKGEHLRADEDRYEHKDGSVQWLRWVIQPWRESGGEIGGVVIFAEDITRRKHAEGDAALFSHAYRSSRLPHAIADARTNRFLSVNAAFAEERGYRQEELVGAPVQVVFPPDQAEMVGEHIALTDRLGHHVFEAEHITRDGRRFPVQIDITAVPGSDGRPPRRIAYVTNISERRAAERAVAEHVKALEASRRAALEAIASMVEQRDPYTAGHERRVSEIAWAIAGELGWPEDRREALRLASLVHDIGKIGVPAEILTRPGRLSQVEFELVKTHAVRGAEILKDVDFPFPVVRVILEHHERMDGSGYPAGLVADQILPESRIAAVADVLESMASHRPYRPALGVDVALAELRANAGRLYDAEVVTALERLFERGYQLPG